MLGRCSQLLGALSDSNNTRVKCDKRHRTPSSRLSKRAAKKCMAIKNIIYGILNWYWKYRVREVLELRFTCDVLAFQAIWYYINTTPIGNRKLEVCEGLENIHSRQLLSIDLKSKFLWVLLSQLFSSIPQLAFERCRGNLICFLPQYLALFVHLIIFRWSCDSKKYTFARSCVCFLEPMSCTLRGKAKKWLMSADEKLKVSTIRPNHFCNIPKYQFNKILLIFTPSSNAYDSAADDSSWNFFGPILIQLLWQ